MSNTTNITHIVTGILKVNTFIITNNDSAVIIDPGGDPEFIIDAVKNYKNILLLLTHSHYDHIGATNEVLSALPHAEYYAHAECAKLASNAATNICQFLMGIDYAVTHTPTRLLKDKEPFSCGAIKMLGIHSTGHSAGHLCYYIPSENAVFCGDLLTAEDIGRHDVPGSDLDKMIINCYELFDYLPEDSIIYPGHGRSLTISESLTTNPHLLNNNLQIKK